MKSSLQIRNELAENKAKAEALADLVQSENRDGFNEEEAKQIEALKSEQEVLNKSLDTAIKYEALVANRLKPEIEKRQQPTNQDDPRLTMPIRFKNAFRKGVFNTAEDAYKSGQWILAAIYNNKKAKQFCAENGMKLRVQNAMTTGDNTKGGFLVPEPLEMSIIELREQFGVFSRYAQQWSMSEAVQNVPKLAGEITSYYVGENSSITASDMSFNLVRLEAKKLAGVAVVSSELSEDSVISVAEAVARSVAYKFSYDEDNAGFNGDGTSTYGGIAGASSVLAAGSIATTATGITTTAALTTTVFENAIGKLPEYAGIQPAWFVHKNTWSNSMQRLMNAVGGQVMGDLAAGAPMMFMGYPVVASQVLYSGTGAVSTIFGYFGDLRMASILGRRRGMQMVADNSIYFLQDATAIRATQRYDINVHDRGTASAAGSLIALKFAAS